MKDRAFSLGNNRRKEHKTQFCMPLSPVFTRDCGGRLNFTDEPTSGLDPLMQNRFVELIGQEKDKGKTMILSSQVWSWQGRHIQTRNIKKSPLRSFVWRVLSPPKNQRVSRPAQKERHPLFVSGRIAGGIGVGGGAEEDLRSRKEWLFSAVGGKIKEKKG